MGQEQGTQMVGTGASDGLYGGDAGLGLLVLALSPKAEHQVPRNLQERNVALDRCILMAHEVVVLLQFFLGLLHDRQRPRLAIICSVDAHAEAHFLGVPIGEIGGVQGEDLVRRDRSHIETGGNWDHSEVCRCN